MGWGMGSPLDMAGLELQLRQWGYYYGEPIRQRPRRVPETVMQRAREFAPGKKDRRQAKGRAGFDRRRYMAKNAGVPGILAAHFVDPVPCPRDTSSGGSSEPAAQPAPPEIQRLNREVNELEEHDLLRGLCLRAQYCADGDRAERCHWVTREFRKAKRDAAQVTEAKFKNEVQFAKVWLLARLTDPRRAVA